MLLAVGAFTSSSVARLHDPRVDLGTGLEGRLAVTDAKGRLDADARENSSHVLDLVKSSHSSAAEKGFAARLDDAGTGLLAATLAGACTTLGALCIFCMPEGGPPPKAMAFALSLAAGVMIAVCLEMLLPQHHDHDEKHHHSHEEEAAWWWWRFCLFACGAVTCFLICRLGDAALAERAKTTGAAESTTETRFRLACLLFLSLTAHNLPEGFAVAVTTFSSRGLGATVCFAVALHNIPEGVALAVSTYGATKSRWKSVMVPACSGLAEPLGALLAIFILRAYLTPGLIEGLLTVVAGVMCYIAAAELLPEAISTQCWASAGAGLLIGFALMVAAHEAFDHAGGHGL